MPGRAAVVKILVSEMGVHAHRRDNSRLSEQQMLASPRDRPTRRRVHVAAIEAGAKQEKQASRGLSG